MVPCLPDSKPHYGASHGGFTSTPNCYSSFGNYDQNTSYQVCASGLCVNKITDASVDESTEPELGSIIATSTFILRCEGNLGNGLACAFSESGERLERFDASCLDAQGNEVRTSAPTTKTKSRRPVSKKKKVIRFKL